MILFDFAHHLPVALVISSTLIGHHYVRLINARFSRFLYHIGNCILTDMSLRCTNLIALRHLNSHNHIHKTKHLSETALYVQMLFLP